MFLILERGEIIVEISEWKVDSGAGKLQAYATLPLQEQFPKRIVFIPSSSIAKDMG